MPFKPRLHPRGWTRTAGALLILTGRAAPGAAPILILVSIAAGLAPTGAAFATKLLMDELAGSRPVATRAVGYALAAVVLGSVALLASYVGGYTTWHIQQRVIFVAEERLYGQVNGLSRVSELENPRFHDKLRLAERAVESAPADVIGLLVGAFRQVFGLGAYFAVLMRVWPPMAGLLLLSAVPALAAEVLVSRQAATSTVEAETLQRRRYYYRAQLVDPAAAREIRMFGVGSLFMGRMMSALLAATAIQRIQNVRATVKEILSGVVNFAVAGVGIVVIVRAAVAGRVSIGDVSLFIAAIASLQGAFSSVIPQFGRASTSLFLFASYLDIVAPASPRQGDSSAALRLRKEIAPRLRKEIEVRDLWFRYEAGAPWVLKGVNFKVPMNCSVGLVGGNGAGKSTLVRLLLGLYEPDLGSLLWDGLDFASLDIVKLRQHIRAALQDFVGYDLTAAENIGIGDIQHFDDRGRMRGAACLAEVDGAISSLPYGYDTLLSRVFGAEQGNTGTQLSGGQWQRVAIARAVMSSEVDLLILDEPSSGLDPEAEAVILGRLQEHRNCARLIISHRLSAIRECDLILVLKDGLIVERGTHDELVGAGGSYARLFALQSAGYLPRKVSSHGA